MARIADLNVSVGVINNIEKGLKSAERSLRTAGSRLSRIGSDITFSISAPLAGIGIAAIKSAGDMEALKNSLTSIMGDAGAASEELEKLRKEALKPGLDFEQAIKGSVRLQSVGMSAEQSRKALAAFGNALSLAGGSAADLDGVSLALSQISAKGKVSAEEINQLAERVPQIRAAMKDAFGTADTEQIQKMGIEAQAFIDGVVHSLEQLPTAQTGIKNSMVNMFTAIRVAMADIGEEIDRTFDLKGLFERVGKSVGELAMWFKGLDDSTKKTIVSVGAFLVALGPALKVVGALSGLMAQTVGIMKSVVGIFSSVASGALTLAANWGKMTVAARALTAATGVGLVLALGAAIVHFSDFSSEIDGAKIATEKLEDGTKAITNAFAKEKVQTDQLFEAIKKTTAGTDERKKAVERLKELYPDYLGKLDLEKMNVGQLTDAQRGLNDEILRGIAARQKTAAVTGILEEQAKLMLRITQLQNGSESTVGENRMIDAIDMVKAGSRSAAIIKVMQDRVKELGIAAKTTGDEFDKTFGIAETKAGAATGRGAALANAYQRLRGEAAAVADADGVPKLADNLNSATKAAQKTAAEIENVHKLVGFKAQNSGMAAAPDVAGLEQGAVDLGGGEVAEKKKQIEEKKRLDEEYWNFKLEGIAAQKEAFQADLEEERAVVAEHMQGLSSYMQDYIANLGGSMGDFGEVMVAMGAAMENSAKQGADSLRDLGKAALKAAANVLRAKIIEGVASVVADSMKKFGLFGLVVAAGAGAAAGGLFNRVIKNLKIPALAEGGLAFAPTLAMVGDNKGAGADPEVIAPLSKLKNMMGDMGGIGGDFSLSHRISGRDLLVVLERTQRDYNRTRG